MMTTEAAYLHKLETILETEFGSLKKNAIIPTEDGFEVFGCYSLQSTEHGTVTKKYNNLQATFSSDKIALGWCVADKLRQYSMSDSLKLLDAEAMRIRWDISILQGILSKVTDYERKDIITAKILNKKATLNECKARLEKCVNVTKYWQIRGFNNEIERTQSSATQRTSRESDRKSARSERKTR